MSDLIDRESLLKNLDHFAPEHFHALVELLIKKEPAVDAIPVSYIVKRIQESCGPESTYLSRLLKTWRCENE